MRTLVGSVAALHWFFDFPRQNPKDLDYWDDSFQGVLHDGKEEIHGVKDYNGLKVLVNKQIASPEELLSLKISHAYWNISWLKTANDILFFQSKGLIPNIELMRLMKKDWEVIHGKKKAYLNKSNEDFFKDNVDRIYEHDSLHATMMYYDEPLYSKCKKDKSKAILSQEIFDNWEEYDKIRLCREEIMVTSLERFLIPSDFTINPIQAYRKAIWKLCTSMTRGFFPEYIILHLTELWNPDQDYVETFNKNSSRLRRINCETART